MRTKKIIINSIAEIIPYLILSFIYFIRIPITINNLGNDGTGYFQYISNIIGYLFLAEAGFTQAVIYKLYEPVAKNNNKKINEIYSGAIYIYRKIAKYMLLLLIGLIIVTTFIIPKEALSTVIPSLILLASSHLIPYAFFSKAQFSVLSAKQEKYIHAYYSNLVLIIFTIISIFAIIYSKSLIALSIVLFVGKVVEEIVLYYIGKKKLKELKIVTEKDTSASKMTKDLIIHSIGDLVVNNVDPMIIMKTMGSTVLSIFSSYNYIINFTRNFLVRITSGVNNMMGNILVTENEDDSYELFKQTKAFNIILSLCFILPIGILLRVFIKIWIKQEIYLWHYATVALFVAILFIQTLGKTYSLAINSKGLYGKSKYFAFVSASINIVLSLILVNFMGIDGLLIGTLVGFIVSLVFRIKLSFKEIFPEKSLKKEYLYNFYILIAYSILLTLSYKIDAFLYIKVNSFFSFLIYATISTTIIVSILSLFSWYYSRNFRIVIKKILSSLKKKS